MYSRPMSKSANKPLNSDAQPLLRFAYGLRHFTLHYTKVGRALAGRYFSSLT